MIYYMTAESDEDLEGILLLQKANLKNALPAYEVEAQGFVTVEHNLELLKKLNDKERHIVAKQSNTVVGYVLSMTKDAREDIPILFPMFEVFDRLLYGGKPISDYNYIVVGQVCVDKNYRGRGVFDACYQAYRHHHEGKYDFAITEIAATNLRSLNAHKRIGFVEFASYVAPDDTNWIVVVWDWGAKKPGHLHDATGSALTKYPVENV